jgi:hypothetical protein
MAANSRVFEALHEIAVALGGVLEPGKLASLVVERARDLLEAGAVGLYVFDDATQTLRPLHSSDAREGVPEPTVAPGEGAAGMAFQLGNQCSSTTILAGRTRAAGRPPKASPRPWPCRC